MFYLDTSLLVAAIMQEPNSEEIRIWLGKQAPKDLLISDWVTTEFSSALSLQMRTGTINPEQRAFALGSFTDLLDNSLSVLTVERGHFQVASKYCDSHITKLRAGDALHLAVAAAHGAIVCTRDEALAKAGPIVGVATRLF